jgi:hypothetical protein
MCYDGVMPCPCPSRTIHPMHLSDITTLLCISYYLFELQHIIILIGRPVNQFIEVEVQPVNCVECAQ